ncbi:MAG: class I mannose-6-phosphate isomerase [Tissierellia bacterium]|nr:class I mannose-6-phosphate isomerase [Tissierellia bacterium]
MKDILFLKGKFFEKIWGGDNLKKEFGYDLPSNKTGEYWAVSGMKNNESIITNFNNINLNKFYKDNPGLFGDEKADTFPLLVKLLDANDDLSIQIHPDDKLANELENSSGKTECWYILGNKESSIIYGHNEKSLSVLKEKIKNGQWNNLFKEVKTNKDDFFYVPSGTIHAIKAGNIILEIQQSSDVTYRLYDYDRKDDKGNLRELHIDKSLKAIDIDPKLYPKMHAQKTGNLIDEKYFGIDYVKVCDTQKLIQDKKYKICCVIEGSGSVTTSETNKIKKGDFFILLNNVSNYTYNGNLKIIEAYSNEVL